MSKNLCASALTTDSRLTYEDHDGASHTIVVREVNMDPEFVVLSDHCTMWEVTDDAGGVWSVFIEDNEGTWGTVSEVCPQHSTSRYDVTEVQAPA
jgi:hypothetical protein